jgi:hypothetical protein
MKRERTTVGVDDSSTLPAGLYSGSTGSPGFEPRSGHTFFFLQSR